ncbi:hypothetical protein NQD34_006675 [Periophthalmus magnuspinnatus]|nr:hypothetical protein NQD34_006675 [Periophthalmus magnuspinnatus]
METTMAARNEDGNGHKRSGSYGLLPPYLSELRLVLLGNGRMLKNSVGNLLLGKSESIQPDKCVKFSGTFQDKPLTVIHTPDQLLSTTSHQELQQIIRDIKDLSAPAPHVSLLVLYSLKTSLSNTKADYSQSCRASVSRSSNIHWC